MSTVRLTEERLRTWALAQEERERMCLGVLAVDPRYSSVKPRRPKGGPDGGHDIEAVYCDQQIVWGGVGFRNNAIDSAEDKTWVRTKFTSDISAALAKDPDLWGFLFFTNMDLTPSEVAELDAIAKEKGVSFVDIFYRERLRIVLDSPRGLGLRFQHLGVPLSEAEQAAFFAEYGSQLEALLHRGFSEVDERLRRLEFFHDASCALYVIELLVELGEDISAEQLGHFRIMAELIDLSEPEPHPTLWIGCRDSYPVHVSEGRETPLVGIRTLAWSRHPDEKLEDAIFSAGEIKTRSLSAAAGLRKRGPFGTLGDLDQKILSIFVTVNVFDKIAAVYASANEYWIAGAPASMFFKLDAQPLESWPEPLLESEAAEPWVEVMLKIEDPPDWMPIELARQGWGIDFRSDIPVKKDSG
jgi:hypothetical protein